MRNEYMANQALAATTEQSRQEQVRNRNLQIIEQEQQMKEEVIRRIDRVIKAFTWMVIGAVIYLFIVTFGG